MYEYTIYPVGKGDDQGDYPTPPLETPSEPIATTTTPEQPPTELPITGMSMASLLVFAVVLGVLGVTALLARKAH